MGLRGIYYFPFLATFDEHELGHGQSGTRFIQDSVRLLPKTGKYTILMSFHIGAADIIQNIDSSFSMFVLGTKKYELRGYLLRRNSFHALDEQRTRAVVDSVEIRAAADAVCDDRGFCKANASQKSTKRASVIRPVMRILLKSVAAFEDGRNEIVGIIGIVARDESVEVGNYNAAHSARTQYPKRLANAIVGHHGGRCSSMWLENTA